MGNEPTVVERAEQPTVGIVAKVAMDRIGEVADRLGDVFGWVAARGLTPAGAPYFRYRVIDMEGELEIEVGVPLETAVTGDGEIVADVLPAGRYVSLTHIGHPDQLVHRTAELLAWADAQGLRFDETDDHWGCRLEIYKSDPEREPDMNKWETELAFRLAD
ncbi:GyrI-like domain-containing protein [Kribbella sp. NBC_01245]|uniref:GyrI-like domain-containing protein n=1 Tax=Kribbella sp. NBC_01245 TaxID=2903578 RepID=UPI002E2D886D|nr:GyrI-like domain-containing protein [Kribbella sp. NBC_01245]